MDNTVVTANLRFPPFFLSMCGLAVTDLSVAVYLWYSIIATILQRYLQPRLQLEIASPICQTGSTTVPLSVRM